MAVKLCLEVNLGSELIKTVTKFGRMIKKNKGYVCNKICSAKLNILGRGYKNSRVKAMC